MPNVDFERRLVSNHLASTMNVPDFKRKLRQVKARLDYEDQDIVRIDFSDTFRPELWCIEGLARQLEPLPGQQYGLALVENLPKIPVHFLHVPQEKTVWVLYVQVDSNREIVDDGYFLKKVRDQIGFGSRQNIDISITSGKESTIAIDPSSPPIDRGDDESETPLPLTLAAGTNTVVITTADQRIGAWLLFTFLCNYLDRGYKPLGFASSVSEKELFAKWNPFVISNQQIHNVFGFQPDTERFRTALESQHYQIHYDATSQTWYISPPIFRFDIIHPIDILEDYLVVTGYDFNEIQPRVAPTNTGSQTKRSTLEERLTNYMQAYGARQTVGLLLDSYENLVDRMCHPAPERLIHLVNAANRNREYAIDSSLPPLLRNALHPSAPVPPSVFFLFTETLFVESIGAGMECRDVSLPPSVGELASARVAHSRWKMGILLVGTEHPFNNAHTLLDALYYHLHLDYTLKRNDSHALIPGRQMTAFCRGGSSVDAGTQSGDTCPPDRVLCVGSLPPLLPIGQFGEVHPQVLTRWELFYPTSFIELDLDSITALWGINKA
jgi:hypothetical protein